MKKTDSKKMEKGQNWTEEQETENVYRSDKTD